MSEFLFAPRHLAQLLQNDAPKFPPRICQVVGDIRSFQTELSCHLFIGKLFTSLVDVLELQQAKVHRLAALLAFLAQSFQ